MNIGRKIALAAAGLAAAVGGTILLTRKPLAPVTTFEPLAARALPTPRTRNWTEADIANLCARAPYVASERPLLASFNTIYRCHGPSGDVWALDPGNCPPLTIVDRAYVAPWCLDRIMASNPARPQAAAIDWKYPVHGDVDANGVVDLDDLLCTLDGVADFNACPGADVHPCPKPLVSREFPRHGGDGVVDLDDLLAVLDAFGRVGGRWSCE